MSKALGSEVALFYTEGWPEGFYVDDWEIDPDPSLNQYRLDEKVDLDKLGVLRPEESADYSDSLSFETAFKRWRRASKFAALTVQVPRGDEAEFRRMMSDRGWKVTG